MISTTTGFLQAPMINMYNPREHFQVIHSKKTGATQCQKLPYEPLGNNDILTCVAAILNKVLAAKYYFVNEISQPGDFNKT